MNLVDATVADEGSDSVSLAVGRKSSLLAQREQAKVSPTYAEPKEGGKVRLVERMNC
jgi:hypothetical protein